jgi:Tol biopolymer transport system component
LSLAFGATHNDRAVDESIHVVDLKTNHVSALPGSEGMWSPRFSPDGRFVAGISADGWNLMLYDVRTRKQTQLHNARSFYPNWSRDGASLFFLSDWWWWRVRMSDRTVERLVKPNTSDWFAVAPNNSLIAQRDVGTDEIYALDWEAP